MWTGNGGMGTATSSYSVGAAGLGDDVHNRTGDGGSGTQSRRHSVSVLQPRQISAGFNVRQRQEPPSPLSAMSERPPSGFGSGSGRSEGAMFSGGELARSLNMLSLNNLDGQDDSRPCQPSSVLTYAPHHRSSLDALRLPQHMVSSNTDASSTSSLGAPGDDVPGEYGGVGRRLASHSSSSAVNPHDTTTAKLRLVRRGALRAYMLAVDGSAHELVRRRGRPYYWREIDLLCNGVMAWEFGSIISCRMVFKFTQFLGLLFLGTMFHGTLLADIFSLYAAVVLLMMSIVGRPVKWVLSCESIIYLALYCATGNLVEIIGRSGDILQAVKENPNVDMSNGAIYVLPCCYWYSLAEPIPLLSHHAVLFRRRVEGKDGDHEDSSDAGVTDSPQFQVF